jgi:glycosyltransferase involved in cell wall biosynthesis
MSQAGGGEQAVQVSVVVPAYNEHDSLAQLHSEITRAIQTTGLGYEILLIDDGSSDGSWNAMRDLARGDGHTRALRLRRHLGKAAGLAAGFAAARGEVIITLDADLQDDPAEIPNFLAKLGEGYHLVCGWKVRRLDPLGKRLPSKIFNAVVSRIGGLRLHDHNCGFRAMVRDVARTVPMHGELHRYLPTLAHAHGFRATEIAVHHRARQFGRSKYGWERHLRGALDLVTALLLGRYRDRPLHLLGGWGFGFGAVGALLGIALIILQIVDVLVPGWFGLSLLALALVVIGTQLTAAGVVAELIVARARPAPDDVAEESSASE